MNRRKFLTAALPATVATIAVPAIAEDAPVVTWRMPSTYPKSLDTVYGVTEIFARRVKEITNGKFIIRTYPAGEIVPAMQVFDAVQAGTVECGHTASYFYHGKDSTFAFDAAIPFGLNSRQQTAWHYEGGGRELFHEFLKPYGVINFPMGNTGVQMGGWFRKEIKTVKDLNGLKMRVPGFAGRVMQRLGVVPQQISPGDIYTALEKGVIDAAEFIGPYDDEKLGLNKVAPYYYTPAWWEVNATACVYVNLKDWNALPPSFRAAFEAASYEAHVLMQAKYDAQNPAALARLLKRGTKIRAFPKEIMDAFFKESELLLEEESKKNSNFKKIYEPWIRFRREQNQWAAVADTRMDNYLNNIIR